MSEMGRHIIESAISSAHNQSSARVDHERFVKVIEFMLKEVEKHGMSGYEAVGYIDRLLAGYKKQPRITTIRT